MIELPKTKLQIPMPKTPIKSAQKVEEKLYILTDLHNGHLLSPISFQDLEWEIINDNLDFSLRFANCYELGKKVSLDVDTKIKVTIS